MTTINKNSAFNLAFSEPIWIDYDCMGADQGKRFKDSTFWLSAELYNKEEAEKLFTEICKKELLYVVVKIEQLYCRFQFLYNEYRELAWVQRNRYSKGAKPIWVATLRQYQD